MRDLLFRAKEKETDIWAYGWYAKDVESIGTEKAPNIDSIIDRETGYWCEVKPETVGQFIGLHDKNNKEIYDGDIVHCWDTVAKMEIYAIVEFGNPNAEYTWGWQLKKIKGDKGVNLDILCWIECEETCAYCEVIGNIYDNPELLD